MMNSRISAIRDFVGLSMFEMVTIVVIVGILLAIALPIYERSLTNAKISEADANLSSIRTQLRVYSSENDGYPITNPAGYVIGADWNEMTDGDISGKYFNDSDYTYLCVDGSNFTITCSNSAILNSDRVLNQSGVLAGGL